jgi:hypothetical protein
MMIVLVPFNNVTNTSTTNIVVTDVNDHVRKLVLGEVLIRRRLNIALIAANNLENENDKQNVTSNTSNPFDIFNNNNTNGQQQSKTKLTPSFIILVALISLFILLYCFAKYWGDRRRIKFQQHQIELRNEQQQQEQDDERNNEIELAIQEQNDKEKPPETLTIDDVKLLQQQYQHLYSHHEGEKLIKQQRQLDNESLQLSQSQVETNIASSKSSRNIDGMSNNFATVKFADSNTTYYHPSSNISNDTTPIDSKKDLDNVCSICLEELISVHPSDILALPCGTGTDTDTSTSIGTCGKRNYNDCDVSEQIPVHVESTIHAPIGELENQHERNVNTKNHEFHYRCIMTWLTQQQGNCPLCKFNVQQYIQTLKLHTTSTSTSQQLQQQEA